MRRTQIRCGQVGQRALMARLCANLNICTLSLKPRFQRLRLCGCYVRNRCRMFYGYARVSTDGQSLDAQLEELKAVGCGQVFREKMSGARSDRPQLAKLLAILTQGDCLVVSRLDRLARSSRDLLNVLHEVAVKGATFRSLGDPWADTTTAHGRLMLTVLGGLAEFERALIRARTGEGRERAMRNGVRFGRKPS
jgi:DNA invertase Pin-like site-specific DNA recombinase